MKLLMLQGIPASGKTTYAREFVKGKIDWVRVSRDDLRNMRGDYWVPKQESFITEVENLIVEIALDRQLNVIIDATNLNSNVIAKWKEIAKTFGAEFEIKRFDITLDTAIERDALRPNPVGTETIKSFFYKYIYKENLLA